MNLSAREIAEALEVPITTLRDWNKKYPVPVTKNANGELRYNEAAREAVELIKSLRDKGRSFDTITRRLSNEPPPGAERSQRLADGLDAPERPDIKALISESLGEIETKFESNLEDKITQSHAVLAEQLGRQVEIFNAQTEQGFERFAALLDEKSDFAHKIALIAHQNGQLQAEVNFLNRQLEKSENQVKMLPSVIEHNDVRRELEAERERRAALESELILAQEKLRAEKRLSWWDKLRGKRAQPP